MKKRKEKKRKEKKRKKKKEMNGNLDLGRNLGV